MSWPSGNFPSTRWWPWPRRARSGTEVSFGEDDILKVKALDYFDFKGTDIVLMIAGGAMVSARARAARRARRARRDRQHLAFRMDPEVPLVVPEVNADALERHSARDIIANPNCSTIQMVVALKPLHDLLTSSAWWSPPTSRCRARARRRWTSCFDQTRAIFVADRRSKRASSPSRSPSTSFPISTSSWMTAHQGGMEDGGRDPEDPGPRHPGHGDLRAGAGLHRPWRGGQYRIRKADDGGDGARRAAGRAGRLVVDKREDGGYVTPSSAPARTRSSSAASARTRRSKTASTSGSSPTICAKARR